MLIWTKNLLIEENIRFLIQKRSWIDRSNWEKHLIDYSETYSEPSVTSTIELSAKVFNDEKLFSGAH